MLMTGTPALKRAATMRTVDKLDKIGPDKVRQILTDDCGLTGGQADGVLSFIAIRGTNAEVLAQLGGYLGRNELFDLGVSELTAVTKYLSSFGVPEENFAVDLTIARGLDYYTGTVYETALLDHPEIGSVCSGGRYDNLAEYYTDRQLPGVGISIGLTRLFYVLDEQGLLNPARPACPADVLIVPMIFVTLAGGSRSRSFFSYRTVPVASSISTADGTASSGPAANTGADAPSSSASVRPRRSIRLNIKNHPSVSSGTSI